MATIVIGLEVFAFLLVALLAYQDGDNTSAIGALALVLVIATITRWWPWVAAVTARRPVRRDAELPASTTTPARVAPQSERDLRYTYLSPVDYFGMQADIDAKISSPDPAVSKEGLRLAGVFGRNIRCSS